MKLIFCMQINIKVSYKVILLLLMGTIKHPQSTQSIKFAIAHLGMDFIFLTADKYHSFCKLSLLFLMEVVRHIQGTHNKKLVIF